MSRDALSGLWHGCPAHPAGCQLPTESVFPGSQSSALCQKRLRLFNTWCASHHCRVDAFEKESCFSQGCFTQNNVSVIKLVLSNSVVSVSGNISESDIECPPSPSPPPPNFGKATRKWQDPKQSNTEAKTQTKLSLFCFQR